MGISSDVLGWRGVWDAIDGYVGVWGSHARKRLGGERGGSGMFTRRLMRACTDFILRTESYCRLRSRSA